MAHAIIGELAPVRIKHKLGTGRSLILAAAVFNLALRAQLA
jgi:hypothetical protein